MKHILSIITVFFILLTSSVSWGESFTVDDLVQRNNLYYKKFTDVPFSGEISGLENGSFKNGKMNGEWLIYDENGQLRYRETYNDGKKHGLEEMYYENGSLKETATYRDGKKLSD